MKLIIFNNVSRFSTVLAALLDVAQNEFEKITVAFPKNGDFKGMYGDGLHNVEFVAPSLFDKIKALFLTLIDFLSKETFEDFVIAKKQNKFSLGYLKTYIEFLLKSELLYVAGAGRIEKDTIVFSTWYSHNAIAAAKVKKKNPNIKTASYAHSYEVDRLKNPYTGVIRDRYKERYLDSVYFISETVMKDYVARNQSFLMHTEKYETLHFGSKKKCDGMAKKSEDGVFRIVTCSGISAVKRLDVLAEALKMYKGDMPIEWTVFGDGPDKQKLENIVNKYDNDVKVNIIGKVANDDVHKYYSNSNADLFVNVSLSEGLPVSIMEAMSYGIPTLATAAGGNHEIVTDETGYPIELDISAEKLCEYIECVVRNKKDCDGKHKNAYDMWLNAYQIDVNVGKLLEKLRK